MRTQNPRLETSSGRSPRWMIRPFVEVVGPDGTLKRVQKRIYLGEVANVKKREALAQRASALALINKSQYVAQNQVPFEVLLDLYLRDFVNADGQLSESTRKKYMSLIKVHIRPAFAGKKVCEVTTLLIEQWLRGKSELSWWARADLRNLMSGIFTQATRWGMWKDANPAEHVALGRQTAKRERVLLTTEQTVALLEQLEPEVRLMVKVALFGTLRISEVLGLQWKHVDFEQGVLMIRQRYWRGDLDSPKSRAGIRDVPMGVLAHELRQKYPGEGHDDEWVFNVPTYEGKRLTRDDSSIRRYFLRPAAERLGLYHKGFGFHSFRRDAITRLGEHLGPLQVAKLAGHSKVDMSLHYTLAERQAQAAAVVAVQSKLIKE